MKNRFFHLMLTGFLGLISFQEMRSQDPPVKGHDYLMPGKGKSLVLLNSGIPYVAIGEYSYGITNRFSIGVLYGYTPVILGYGLRIKTILAQPSERMRIILKSPMIYYPKTTHLGGDPWVLAWPTLSVEWKLKNGSRIWTGAGVVAASCVDQLFGNDEGATSSGPESVPGMKKNGIMSGVWNTIQIGYSKPITNRLSWTMEMAPVLKGLKLAGKDWIAGPPVIVTFGVSYSL